MRLELGRSPRLLFWGTRRGMEFGGVRTGMGMAGNRPVSNMRIIMIGCRKASMRTRFRGDGLQVHMLRASEVTHINYTVLSLSRFATTSCDTTHAF